MSGISIEHIKKFIISIFIAVLVFFLFDFLFYLIYHTSYYYTIVKPDKNYNISCAHFLKNEIADYSIIYNKFDINNYIFRPIQNKDSKEQPIIIFGCSYAFGYNFDNKETLSYILSKYSNRPIINRAICGWGIQHMIWQLQNVNFSKIMNNIGEGKNIQPKYVLYVLMEDSSHFGRMISTSADNFNEYNLIYYSKNGKLYQKEPPFKIYLKSDFLEFVSYKYKISKVIHDFNNNDKKLFDLFILHFRTANNLIKEKFGKDTKLIVITFENIKRELWQKELEKEGIDVVDIGETLKINSLHDDKLGFFYPPQSPHPTAKLWEELLPKLKEKYSDL